MIHPTARRLDEPPMIFGFTVGQLLALTVGSIGSWIAHDQLGLGFRALVFGWAFLVLLPVLLHRVTESGGVNPGRLVLDAAAFARRRGEHRAGAGERTVGVLVYHDPDAPRRARRDREAIEIPWN